MTQSKHTDMEETSNLQGGQMDFLDYTSPNTPIHKKLLGAPGIATNRSKDATKSKGHRY